MRKWFLWALLVSLFFHAILAVIFQMSKLERFDASPNTERLVPRAFAIKAVRIDPKMFEPEKETSSPQATVSPKLPAIAPDKPLADKVPDKVKLTPNPAELAKPLLNEKPKVDASLPKMAAPHENAAIRNELDSISKQLINERAPKIAAGSELKFPPGTGSPDGVEGTKGAPGFSDIDDLLGRSGPLTGDVAPVNMPGGALFEYDSTALRSQSVAMLQKLGELIKRNPHATFSIEGHTDSFGDPAYNQKLSEARAVAVKDWLVSHMGLDPSNIQTRGFGSTRLIVPSGTQEEQQPNRRVEIIIRTPKK